MDTKIRSYQKYLKTREQKLPLHKNGTQEEQWSTKEISVEAEDDGTTHHRKLLQHDWVQPIANLVKDKIKSGCKN